MIETNKIYHIDAIEGMKTLPENSIDSIVTDPPYGYRFMGKKWDYSVPSVDVWKEAIRVLKPGGHILCACGTRTQHRMAVNIEDAGFEIRDVITWHYGSGFPKSLDVSKAIDKQAGLERQRFDNPNSIAFKYDTKNTKQFSNESISNKSISDAAKQWEGWGTALKPSTEFWTLARKPFKGTVAENVLKYGTGGINIDGSRIGYFTNKISSGLHRGSIADYSPKNSDDFKPDINNSQGRFPANLILDEYAAEMLDQQSGVVNNGDGHFPKTTKEHGGNIYGVYNGMEREEKYLTDGGGASRFFYVAKASKSERGSHNSHPTVKPLELMQYLIKLITPPDGIFLDPFCGSGSTLIAGALIGFKYIGFDNDEKSISIARQRMKNELGLFNRE